MKLWGCFRFSTWGQSPISKQTATDEFDEGRMATATAQVDLVESLSLSLGHSLLRSVLGCSRVEIVRSLWDSKYTNVAGLKCVKMNYKSQKIWSSKLKSKYIWKTDVEICRRVGSHASNVCQQTVRLGSKSRSGVPLFASPSTQCFAQQNLAQCKGLIG